MLPLRIVAGIYGVFPDTAQCFAYANGRFVFIIDCQQYFFHAVLLCDLKPKAKDLFAISFSLFRYSDCITNASDIHHYLFGEFGPELKFSDEFAVINCPIVKTDRLTFNKSLFFSVIP